MNVGLELVGDTGVKAFESGLEATVRAGVGGIEVRIEAFDGGTGCSES